MKPFESFLAEKLEHYLAFRRNLGYAAKNERSRLRPLDRYVRDKAQDWQALTPRFFLAMRKELGNEARVINGVLSTARGFFHFLIRQGHCQENPLQDIPPRKENAFIPFVFSPQAVEELLTSIRNKIRKDQQYFLPDFSVYTAILLMARCGLRISEPLRLKISHYRLDDKTLAIEKTKFAKDRLIPLPLPTASELENYLAARGSLRDCDQNPFLLPAEGLNPLSPRHVYSAFHQAVQDIGLSQPRRIIANTTFGAPTPHSLRHSWAINTLKQIRLRGGSPNHALPVLSAYLGHCKYRYTAVYLKVLDAEHRQGLVDFATAKQEEL